MKIQEPRNEHELTIAAEAMRFDAAVATQDELFSFIGSTAFELGITNDARGLAEDLAAREDEMATGLMDEFAIPHAKTPRVMRPSVIYVRTERPVPWHMLTGDTARHFFALLVSPEDGGAPFVRMLSKLAACLMEADFRSRVAREQNPNALSAYLNQRISEC